MTSYPLYTKIRKTGLLACIVGGFLLSLGVTFLPAPQPYVMVLGIAQDAGYPQAGCEKRCCKPFWQGKTHRKLVASLALVDPAFGKAYLFDATPDFPTQLQRLRTQLHKSEPWLPDGIFLTHAHIGHYTGLMHLGREVMGTKDIPVFAMPKMRSFLSENGPWQQLIALANIRLSPLKKYTATVLRKGLQVFPILVPHRDEYSETVGFRIEHGNHKLLFIPDIDKWEKWNRSLSTELKTVQIALLDGTFFRNGELPNRDMSEVPHPFVVETMALLKNAPAQERKKVVFIHFNHTNPLLRDAEARKEVIQAGFGIAEELQLFHL